MLVARSNSGSPTSPSERSGRATAAPAACPLSEVDPQPQSYADIVGIEVVALIGEEVVGRDGHEDIRINSEIVSNKSFEANPGPKDQGRIILAEAGVNKFESEVRASVRDGPSLQDRSVGDMEFRKAPEPVARELIEIARHFGKPSDLQILLRKIAKAATEIQHGTAFLLSI